MPENGHLQSLHPSAPFGLIKNLGESTMNYGIGNSMDSKACMVCNYYISQLASVKDVI